MSATTARSSLENSPERKTNNKKDEPKLGSNGGIQLDCLPAQTTQQSKFWSVTEVIQEYPEPKIPETIVVIFDFRNINYHKDFTLIPEAVPKQAEPQAPAEPAPRPNSLPEVDPWSTQFKPASQAPSPRALPAAPSLANPPKSYPHMSQKSILAPLSGSVEQKKPRLEDKKLIEFMIIQTSKSCTDTGYLQRVKKTIKKIKLYWSKSNLIYPFAFRKLKTRMNQKPAGQHEGSRRNRVAEELLKGEGGNPDLGYFIITEDFSKKRVNPDGPSKSWDTDSRGPNS